MLSKFALVRSLSNTLCTGVSCFQKSQPATSKAKQKRQELALCFVDHRQDFLQFGPEIALSIFAVSNIVQSVSEDLPNVLLGEV